MNDANSEFTGKFCWEEIAGVAVPFIIRSSGKMLAEIGMLKGTLFKKYLQVLDDAVFKIVCPSDEELPPKKYPIATLEMKLLDEINILHCDRSFGMSRFSSDALLLEKEDVVQVYQVLQLFYKAVTEKNIGHSKCGYIRIEESKTSVPFVDVSGADSVGIVVPLFFFECPAAMRIKFELKDHWSLVCLKLLCKMLGVLSNFYDHPTLMVVKLFELKDAVPEIHRFSYFKTLPLNVNVSELIRPKTSNRKAIIRTSIANFGKKDVVVISDSDSEIDAMNETAKAATIVIKDDEESNKPKRKRPPTVRPLRKYCTNYSPYLPKLAPKNDPTAIEEGDTTPDNRDDLDFTTETESSQSNSCEEVIQEPSKTFKTTLYNVQAQQSLTAETTSYNMQAEQTSAAVASSTSTNSVVSYVYTPTQPVLTPVLGNTVLQPNAPVVLPSMYTANVNSSYIANPQMGLVTGSMGTPAYLMTPGTLTQVTGYGPVMAQTNVSGQQQQTNLSTVTTPLPGTIAILPQQEHISGIQQSTFINPPTSNLGPQMLAQTVSCITQPGCLPVQLGELGAVAQPALVPLAQAAVVPIVQSAVVPLAQPAVVPVVQPAVVPIATTSSSDTCSTVQSPSIQKKIAARLPESGCSSPRQSRLVTRMQSGVLPSRSKAIDKFVADAQKNPPIISWRKLKALRELLKNKTLQSCSYQVEKIPEYTDLKGPLPYTVKKWQFEKNSMVCISISPLCPDTLLINIEEIKQKLFYNVNRKVFMAITHGLNLKIYCLNASQKTAVAMYRKSIGKPNVDEFEEHLYFVLSKFSAAYDLMKKLSMKAMQNSFYVCDNFCDHSNCSK